MDILYGMKMYILHIGKNRNLLGIKRKIYLDITNINKRMKLLRKFFVNFINKNF